MSTVFPCVPQSLGEQILQPLQAFSGKWTGEDNETMAFLAHQLAKPVDDPPTDIERAAIEALCRKVDIAKRLMVRYDADWKKPAGDELAPDAAWVLTSALLIHQAQLQSSDNARTIKYLNSAFNAADHAEAHRDALHRLAQSRLEEILRR